MLNPTINLDRSPDALDALSPELRQAVSLSYFSGFSNEQIAGLLGVTLEVVEARLREANSALAL
jgi:DNA-directed RNA polymerase specialized sigma24 family protein